jgi:hypothetical protein
VTDGGTITGKVTLKGAVPEPSVFPLALFPFGPYCNKNKVISDSQGKGRGFKFSFPLQFFKLNSVPWDNKARSLNLRNA